MLRIELTTQLMRIRTLIALACLAAIPVIAGLATASSAGHQNDSQGGLSMCVLAAGLATGLALFGWHPFHIIGAPALTARPPATPIPEATPRRVRKDGPFADR